MYPLSLEQAIIIADDAVARSDFRSAARMFSEILLRFPDEARARVALRFTASRIAYNSKEAVVKFILEQMKAGDLFEQHALMGWVYASQLDSPFIDGTLESGSGQSVAVLESSVTHIEDFSVQQVLEDLASCVSPIELYGLLSDLTRRLCTAVVADSYFDDQEMDLARSVEMEFQSKTINIVIIGAGPVGLTLANSLNLALGDRARILVLENRICRSHCKRVYSRRWPTLIPLAVLRSVIDDDILDLLSIVGDEGCMGVSIDIYETLLLLSCKKLGVKFLFEENSNLACLENSQVDILFDASGGRFAQTSPMEDASVRPVHGPTFTHRGTRHFCGGFRRFGVDCPTAPDEVNIETMWIGDAIAPFHNGQRIKVASFKVIGVPIELYQPLLAFIAPLNQDNRFYVWPAFLKPSINDVLLIINLKKDEYESMRSTFPKTSDLTAFVTAPNRPVAFDPRIWQVLEWIAMHSQGDRAVTVEAPFVFAPYLRPYSNRLDALLGKPLIRVGDSVFNGNPKTGNGLGRHLSRVRSIHDIFLCALASN